MIDVSEFTITCTLHNYRKFSSYNFKKIKTRLTFFYTQLEKKRFRLYRLIYTTGFVRVGRVIIMQARN